MQLLSRLLLAGLALGACCITAQPFVDGSRAELLAAAPDLSALQFDPDQTTLAPLLRNAGQQLASMIAKFINVSISEDIHEMRFDSAQIAWKEHHDKFVYIVRTNPFTELRRQAPGGEPVQPDAKSVFLISGDFVETLSGLLPENQSQWRFRYLGRMSESGLPSLVVAFARQDGSREGLVWIDEATKQILRCRIDTLRGLEKEKLDSFTRDVRFVAVKFRALDTVLSLPYSATLHIRFATGEAHSVHRFSGYHVDGSEKDTGEPARPANLPDDAFEVLLNGIVALEAGKPDAALHPLLDAERLLPDRSEPSYYLGLALYDTHDLARAEAAFRKVVKRSPQLAAAHNELGVLLFTRGDKTEAVAEFQEALRLEPGNAKMRANLDGALTSQKAANAAGQVAIQVDVRQVLVPVVVTDKEGHHVLGLTEADFKVFEDGAEQKITAFSSERADVPNPVAPGEQPGNRDPVAPGLAKPLATRHVYVICLDLMHASFSNFVYVREALQKLFREERAGDSQYALIALSNSMDVIQNITSDPAQVLETLRSPSFGNTSGQKNSSQFEATQYERQLQEVRAACDGGDPSCGIQKQMLPAGARQLAEHERLRTIQFLSQLGSVVQQLSRGAGRRTLVLISDGFLLAPGELAYGLLEAYFPEFRSNPIGENVQDLIQPIFKMAVKENVTIDTIDSRGLFTQPGLDASRSVSPSGAMQVDRVLNNIATSEGLTLSEIAGETGGTSFKNSNDIFLGLQRSFADGREYYVLAYTPSNENQDGKFRKIEVRVRDKKARVNAKRGYWASAK